jgi:hypothetical protein
MSDKDQRKKDGRDRGKDRQAMRAGREFESRKAAEEKHLAPDQTDREERDIVTYKPGSARDRNRSPAARLPSR